MGTVAPRATAAHQPNANYTRIVRVLYRGRHIDRARARSDRLGSVASNVNTIPGCVTRGLGIGGASAPISGGAGIGTDGRHRYRGRPTCFVADATATP